MQTLDFLFRKAPVLPLLQELLTKYFSVFHGRKPLCLSEHSAEIHRILIPYSPGDLRNRVFRCLQEDLRIVDPQIQNILHGRRAKVFPETCAEPAHAHISCHRILLDADVLIVVFLEITPRIVHFRSDKPGRFRQVLIHSSIHDNKQFTQDICETFLITELTFLQLIPHLFKKVLILIRNPCMNNIVAEWNLIVPEYALHRPSGKMHEPVL